MSFHASAHNITLKDGHELRCELENIRGEFVKASMDLNDHSGNNDGWFWDGRNFSRSARNISLTYSDRGPKLEADLQCANGSYRERQGLYLADRIVNKNGTLVFLHR